ncbi:fasciclin [Pedobacter sp. HMWF019]|uniref:fasciclin domain-containing protein n=1 Tax=Pedobacter sp. HMWF019 TaxID=2056856 RepID=UPI000D37F02F|nr:fasciclin domain-containing protein [Pedobacter sp. HMWF019]PTS99148.1 fasciclin [Pedobacter sp. HMWF019]
MNTNLRLKPLFLPLLFLVAGLGACKKAENIVTPDSGSISRVIADNFNLSIFNAGLVKTGLTTKLLEEGPFTVIAPSDDAFKAAGYNTTADMIVAEPAVISPIMRYHVLNGRFDFSTLPFLFNQEIRSYNGGKLFVTRWVKGPDTILTINGAVMLTKNVKASNGLVQVVNRVLQPYTFEHVVEVIANDRDLSLFYQALQRAGLTEMLGKNETYTIFAPNNAAMKAYGLTSLQDIEAKDPADLGRMLRYHILADRRFVYDYILSSGKEIQSQQTMVDGNSITIKLVANPSAPGTYSGITLQGTGNTTGVEISKTQRDVLAGNGVVHTIQSVLRITQ